MTTPFSSSSSHAYLPAIEGMPILPSTQTNPFSRRMSSTSSKTGFVYGGVSSPLPHVSQPVSVEMVRKIERMIASDLIVVHFMVFSFSLGFGISVVKTFLYGGIKIHLMFSSLETLISSRFFGFFEGISFFSLFFV